MNSRVKAAFLRVTKSTPYAIYGGNQRFMVES